MQVNEKNYVLNSKPSQRGLSIRQYVDLNTPDYIPGPMDTVIFIDGKKLKTIQGIRIGFSVDDLTIDVDMTMLANNIDIDILEPKLKLMTSEDFNNLNKSRYILECKPIDDVQSATP